MTADGGFDQGSGSGKRTEDWRYMLGVEPRGLAHGFIVRVRGRKDPRMILEFWASSMRWILAPPTEILKTGRKACK